MARLTPELHKLLDTPIGSARLFWRSGDWHRLTPILQAWATFAVPMGSGISGDDVDDLVSHVIVRAWTSPVVPDNPRGWVSTVIANKIKDHRKSYDATHRSDTAADDIEGRFTADDLVEELEHRRRIGRLRNALRRLDDDLRRVVVLYDLKQRTHEQIADALGITVGASRMRCIRGRRILAKLYELTPLPELNEQGLPPKPRGRAAKPIAWRQLPQNSGTAAARVDLASRHAAAMLFGAL